jgi:hypothetical protein
MSSLELGERVTGLARDSFVETALIFFIDTRYCELVLDGFGCFLQLRIYIRLSYPVLGVDSRYPPLFFSKVQLLHMCQLFYDAAMFLLLSMYQGCVVWMAWPISNKGSKHAHPLLVSRKHKRPRVIAALALKSHDKQVGGTE